MFIIPNEHNSVIRVRGYMVNDKETKKQLQKCAMKEFTEKGYMKASLRNICKDAGVTTGALYFFFKDKDALFKSLVDEPLKGLVKLLTEHYIEEIKISDMIAKGEKDIPDPGQPENFEDDFELAMNAVGYLFKYKDVFELLLTKAQGSSYENMVDKIVGMTELHYSKMFAVMKGYKSEAELTDKDRFIIHWMSHDQIEIFIHVLTHCKDREEAEGQIKNLLTYIIGGWLSVVQNGCSN